MEFVPCDNGYWGEAAPGTDDSEADDQAVRSARGTRRAGRDGLDVEGCAFANCPFRCVSEARGERIRFYGAKLPHQDLDPTHPWYARFVGCTFSDPDQAQYDGELVHDDTVEVTPAREPKSG